MLARFKAFDWIFISAVFALAVFGLLMVYSASYPAAINSGQPATAVVSRQLMFFCYRYRIVCCNHEFQISIS